MIIDFARVQSAKGADVLLDLWDDMPHDFQAMDSDRRSSAEALVRIRDAVLWHTASKDGFDAGPRSVSLDA